MDRDKLIDIITEANAFYVTDKDDIGIADRYEMSHKLADHLIANGIGDITTEKHRANVAEEALRELIAEMYENGVRPICNQEMLYETRLEQAEQRLGVNETK